MKIFLLLFVLNKTKIKINFKSNLESTRIYLYNLFNFNQHNNKKNIAMNGNENQNAAQIEAQLNNIQVESSTNENMTTDDAV